MQRNLKQKLEGLVVIVQQQRAVLAERDAAHQESAQKREEVEDQLQVLTTQLAASEAEVTNLTRKLSDEEKLKVDLSAARLEVVDLKQITAEQHGLAKVGGGGVVMFAWEGGGGSGRGSSACEVGGGGRGVSSAFS